MYGMFVNCRKAPFVSLMLDKCKRDETRSRNTLKPLIGQRVALIETGTRKRPFIRGYATITGAVQVSYDDTAARKAAGIYNTPYDIKPGVFKWFYRLADVEGTTPYSLPEHVNHGRAYTEF